MGVDEALLATAAAGGPPSLRFYTWDAAWLSLGYGQKLGSLPERCRWAGVGLVRRSTGGRAVLHGADLTYAVAAPQGLLPAGLDASYARIAAGLSRALAGLGVRVEPAPVRPAGSGSDPFDCFAEPASHELCVAGRKLVGSAQRRAHGAVLQHGSLRLRSDPSSAARAAGVTGAAATSLLELGCQAAPERVREALADGLAAALGAELQLGVLSRSELAAARHRGTSSPGVPHLGTPGDSSRGLPIGRYIPTSG